ncbi:MAG TPA: tetratricopeptide repeat protein [Gemmatimonadales bacterium]
MIRKRDARWASATERAKVAAQLLEEAQALSEECAIASPADVARSQLPAPLHAAALESVTAPVPVAADPAPAAPRAPAERGGRLVAGDMVEALNSSQRELEQRLRSTPDDAAALLGLGVLLCRKGLWAVAVAHLRRAAELAPGEIDPWCRLGETLNKLDDLEGARAAYERAVALDAGHPRALYGLGVVFDRLSRPADATAMYRRSREAAGR